ncbi:CHASE domain-containing hybrid sensor histidine kinase/response regulator [Roseateles puraquae]|uniref:CHASE domain-containing hybrid sensor histidine kinase/response regulator n=1 Tax=Roseateles puraquae TaxID=431059 RepID=UPI0031DFFE9F
MHGYVGRGWFWVGLLGVIATGVASSWLSRENQQRLTQELERQADRVAQQVETRFGLYEYGLRGARGAILAGGGAEIRRETFATYSQSRELSREFPGARGFGFIRRWPLGQDAEALRRARADGMANFQLRELAPNPGERFVIEYIYPLAPNLAATGLDIASERNRRDTALAAARMAAVRLTGPITLVQADQKSRQGFLMLLPVYAPGGLPEGGAGRLAATLGWAFAPLLADEVLKPLLETFPLVSIGLAEVDEPGPFFETHPGDADSTIHRLGSAERTLSVFGRTWRLQVLASPALPAASRLAPVWLVLALGSLFSLMLALITRLATVTPPTETASERLGSGLKDFVRSPLARWSLLVLLAMGSAYAAFNWWQVRASVAARLERELQALMDQRAATGEAAMKGRQAALGYLRGTPPVDGLIRSEASGRDPLDGSSKRFWQQRMAQIFGAYAKVNPDAQELRLIRLAGTASQLVTWRRSAGGASEGPAVLLDQAPDPARLRVLAELRGRLLRGEAWTHPVEAQKRSVPGAEPLRQTIRYTLPVLDGATLYGVLEMDIDVSARFGADALRLPWGGSLHVLNSEERWLTRQGLLEGQPGEGWSDRYTPALLGIDTPAGRLRAWQGPQGGVLSAQSIIDPNPGDLSARVIYRAVVPTRALDEEVMVQWQSRMVAPAVLGGLLYGLLFLYWRLQQGHQGRLAALNADLERQVAEQTQDLQNERSRLSNILEGTGAGTWEWNAQTGETRVNARWAEILGYALDTLPPMTPEAWTGLIHPEDLAHTHQLLVEHLRGESPQYVCEGRLRHREQRWVWTLSTGRVMSRTPDGRAQWVTGTLMDMSEMRAAREERERFANLLRGVLQAATDFSIIATEPDGLITVFNAGAERLLGYRADEMVGRQSPAVIHLASEVGQRGAELSASEGQEVQGFRVFVHKPEREGSEQREWTYVRKDGSHVPVSLTVTVVRNEHGDVVGYLGIAQDISARLTAERALRHAKAAAEQASAAKGMFLANMSHEIRTPMNAVIGIAHLLADTPLTEDQRQLLRKLQVAGRSLLGVINDVLDLSKIEAGELAVEQTPYQLPALLRELDAVFADQARGKGLDWELSSAAEVPDALIGDPQRLQQVLSNLLSNAIKFTSQGGVSLRVELDGQHQGLRFLVRDSGIGIAPQAQAQLFQPFVQAEASTTRQFGGTGLGLSIVKHLVGLMGGTVALESQLGQGSLFTVTLPLLEGAPVSGAKSQRLEAVIVEDEAVQRERLVSLCAGFGWQARGMEAAEALLALMQQRQQAGQALPDVLLVDWHLGDGLDGISAMRRLREGLPTGRVPAVLLITQDQRRALQTEDIDAVVDAVLAKPANPSTLFNAVNEAIAKRKGDSEHLLDPAVMQRLGGGLLPDVRLLVVDDSDINLEVARRMLERQGAVVHCDNHAEAALARLGSGEDFDAVLMDIQMPGMDGLEATRQVREKLQRRDLPVIALTAGALVDERRRALDAGMDDFLTKPLDPEALVRTLRRHIEDRRGAPLPVRGIEALDTLPADWPLIDGIEAAATAHRLGGDAALFRRLLARLLELHDAAWVTGLASMQANEAAAELHRLRGSAGLLGAQRVQALAAEGEEALRGGATPAALGELFSGLGQALDQLTMASRSSLEAMPTPVQTASNEVLQDGVAELARLEELLAKQDMEAAAAFESLRPWLLQQGMQAASCQQLQRLIDDLDFSPALAELQAWMALQGKAND